jgi:hypothetical protein
MNVPVRADALGAWKLRFSSHAAGYGGSGLIPAGIPALTAPAGTDAPKRLLDVASERQIRTIRLPAWSAAVYVRDLDLAGDDE